MSDITLELVAVPGADVAFETVDTPGDDIAFEVLPGGGGSGGVTDHADLTGRDAADQHPASAIDVDGTPLDDYLANLPTSDTLKVAQFVGHLDVTGGDFTTVSIIGGATIPRVYLVGRTVLVTQGPNVATVWTVTSSGPCTEGDALTPGALVTSQYAGQTATISATDGSTLGVIIHDPNPGTGFRPWSSKPWMLLGTVGGAASYYSTTEFPAFSGAFETRAHLMFLSPDPADTGEGDLDFWEYATQERQAAGEWGDDQDNNEDAGYYSDGRIGVFNEQCQTDSPAETMHGEHGPSRIYSLKDGWPDGSRYFYKDPAFELHLGDEIVLRKTYDPDYGGVWRKVFWRECSSDVAEDQTTDGRWWRRIVDHRGDTTGSFQSSNQPWHIGLYTGGLFAIRWEEVYDGIDDTLVLHFDTDDLQGDGTVESSQVAGQTWTATGTPTVYDPSLVTLAELLAGGGGGGVSLGETSTTAYRGDRGKTAYDHSQATGNPHGTTAADVGAATSGHNHSGVYDPAGSAATAQAAAIAASQPVDSDLTAIAALTTTSFGRSLLTQADAAATLATIGAASATAVPFKAQVGDWVAVPHDGIFTAVQTLNRVAYVPFLVPAGFAQTDGIAVEVTTVATSALCRLGIYLPHATTGRPGALVIDGGTVDFSSGGGAAGIRTLTITATALTPGSLVYVAVVPQGATATARHSNSGEILRSYGTASSTVADVFRANGGAAYYENSVSGALPANATPTFGSIIGQPVVALRRSA